MFIPIRTDRRLQRTPWINYALVAANVLVFVLFQGAGAARPAAEKHLLHSYQPELGQFLSSMFMHAGWVHLLGNMLFLWVFGNAVNDKLGHVGYAAFYLAGGIIAGMGYIWLGGGGRLLGASGAISAVTGAFLVLFPRVRVTVLALLIYMLVPIEIPSLIFLLMQFAWNVWASTVRVHDGVAYVAHASGYVFGIGICGLLLYLRLLPREAYDLLALLRSRRRRAAYQRAVAGGYDPFGRSGAGVRRAPTRRRWVEARVVGPKPAPATGAETELRQEIGESHRRGDYRGAAEGYLKLVQLADDPTLPLAQQLDVANQLMADEQYPAAGDAYERFLQRYGQYEHIGDIRLMLGLIYGRYLRQYDRAEAYLSRAVPDLLDAGKAEMARNELAKVREHLGR